MKFKIKRETLLKPLQFVIGVVERRQTLPVLSNLLLQADTGRISLTATDLEVELVANFDLDVQDGGEITIPARKFLDICKALPDDSELNVGFQKERVQVRSGKSRFTLSTLPAAEFPLIEDIKIQKEFSVPQRELKKLIERTHFAMAQQDVRYYLNGLLFEIKAGQLRTVATDGHRLAICEVDADISGDDHHQVIVPRKGIQELARLLEDSDDLALIQLGANHIRIQLPDLRFTSKLIDGKFPDYNKVLPKASNKFVNAERDTLKQALIRTSILSNEKYRGVRLNLEEQRLSIQAHNPEQEEAEEEVTIEYQGDPIEIGFNVNYILDALNAIPENTVTISLSDSNSSCLIEPAESKDCRYVVMPMRL
jgi:DNA polymerase-3 subunit beta